jgi:transcriptional regulator with XRE-family HTH domain
MKSNELRRIREKLELSREDFASFLCLSGYGAYANIENDIRKPSKLTIRLLRYIDSLSKKHALDFIEEFSCHETK